MENLPLVSVIIPVHNGENYLADAIESVLGQNYQPLEILVIDDGSTDKTAEIAKEYGEKIRYIYQLNAGPAAARNAGIKLANGDILGFLDADDLWSENCLHALVTPLREFPEILIAQGLIQELELSESQFQETSVSYQYINLGSALYRRVVFDKLTGFDATMRYGEDVDFFLRAWENNIPKTVIKTVTLFYRKHEQNMTAGKKLVDLGFLRVYKKHIERKRQRQESALSLPTNLPPLSEYLGVHPSHPRFQSFN
ncbi:glycosyltransferase family 2 protein [Phormidium sp. CCY1219]|uniref:glycosyltransferase family 2 protein n=1 Tax=Phormidium sp. CCY1219 TaxID=2886104 RepID=UPI002D1EB09C|nr:glycosyltransferase family A protein [Phormidium sp. CCY1219]MEB3829138.1 glycosyltransferase family 2 protein [Phormidium sp. CCY1219]